MTQQLSDFDGDYDVAYSYAVPGLIPGMSARVHVQNGHFSGTDRLNVKWSGQIEIKPENVIGISVRLDPTGTPADVFVPSPTGQMVRVPVQHRTVAKAVVMGKTIRMAGKMRVGPIEIEFNMTKVG